MGTNYYWQSTPCVTCGHSQERLHIGKKSSGWVFLLRVHPWHSIGSLGDWQEKWKSGQIVNEYEEVISPDELLEWITQPAETRHENSLSRENSWDVWDREFS